MAAGGYSDVERREALFAQALGHPCRIRIMRILATSEQRFSPVQLAPLVDQPLGVVSYHVRQLAQAGLLELVEQRVRRGAIEHLYAVNRVAGTLAAGVLSSASVVAGASENGVTLGSDA